MEPCRHLWPCRHHLWLLLVNMLRMIWLVCNIADTRDAFAEVLGDDVQCHVFRQLKVDAFLGFSTPLVLL